MRQIGVRDEAKLLADYGDCGKPVCCNTHLVQMPPVSMKMAKLQKSTLDPTKISGRCGRLKCCLRYEYDTYEELQKDMPPVGSDVVTEKGRAKILAQEILAGQLLIRTEDGRRVMIPAEQVLSIIKRGTGELERRGRGRRDSNESKDASTQRGSTSSPAGDTAPRAEATQENTGPSQEPSNQPAAPPNPGTAPNDGDQNKT